MDVESPAGLSGLEQPPGGVVVAVSAIVVRSGRVLLIRRAKDPARGLWSLPGGHLLVGESLADGVARELQEETALVASAVGPLVAVTEILRPGLHYLVIAYRVDVEDNQDAVAGSDADAVVWADAAECEALATTKGLTGFLESHSVFS